MRTKMGQAMRANMITIRIFFIKKKAFLCIFKTQKNMSDKEKKNNKHTYTNK